MDVLTKIILNHQSGVVEDQVNLTWAFRITEATAAADIGFIRGDLEEFLNGPIGGLAETVGEYFSPEILRGADLHLMKTYEVPVSAPGDPLPPLGSPIDTRPFSLTPAARNGSALPTEVAVCLSFHSSLVGVDERIPMGPAGPEGDALPRQRRRGRVFLGPLNVGALGGHVGTSAARPLNGMLITMALSAGRLRDSAESQWCVWSRVDRQHRDVVGGWLDNAFDTQRRRGVAATTRIAVPAAP